jgi:hypothetical protein
VANRYLKHTVLHVEGRNDLFTIANLLEKHSFQVKNVPRDLEIHKAALDDQTSGRDELLKLIGTAVKASTDSAVGFVIDADRSSATTWSSVQQHIHSAIGPKFKSPKTFPTDGFVADIADLKSRVGVWIMPDNLSAGILEDFLQRLIDDKDQLLPIAKRATSEAKKAGAKFKSVAESKAITHAWLAWQENPGCPFGTAIKAQYFDYQAKTAKAFVAWVRRLID